jgi:hypothetical protein
MSSRRRKDQNAGGYNGGAVDAFLESVRIKLDTAVSAAQK